MHNSGTSLLGNLLHGAGVPMGNRLLLRRNIPAPRRPRYDYFEDKDVVALQEQTLLDLQRHWSSYRGAFPLPAEDSPGRRRFREALARLVNQRLRRQGLWAVKDPRSGVLLQDWLRVLTAEQVDLRLLIVSRDPTSNIQSFSSKGQVPAAWAEALWQRTYANALEVANTLPAHHSTGTQFQRLLEQPETETRRLLDWLGWRAAPKLAERLAERLDPSLPTLQHPPAGEQRLHPATELLWRQLSAPQRPNPWMTPTPLLADEMAGVVAESPPGLQVNGRALGGQSLLPKIHVTVVTAELQGWGPSGGIGSAYQELMAALAEAGHDLAVVLVNSQAPEQGTALPPGVSLQVVDPTGLTRLQLVRRVADAVAALATDVVHLHDWLGLGSGLRDRLGPDGPPLIVGLHGPSAWTRSGNPWPTDDQGGITAAASSLYAEGVVRALEVNSLQQADVLIAPSAFMATWVCEHLLPDRASQSIAIQRNCPLRTRLRSVSGGKQARELVFFGRLEERKGLRLFLQALSFMEQRPASVLFLGGDCPAMGDELGSEQAVRHLTPLGIPYRFESELNRDQALELLSQARGVVVVPSLIENSPCVLEELLDSGLRVVATDVGGNRELVAEESLRWLSPAKARALAHHLDAAINDPDPEAYRLRARIPGWAITLSWQAFHERHPRRHQRQAEAQRLRVRLKRRVWNLVLRLRSLGRAAHG